MTSGPRSTRRARLTGGSRPFDGDRGDDVIGARRRHIRRMVVADCLALERRLGRRRMPRPG
jgi:hypothetical protein